ncbi:WxL domain-containing protein [Enterococcus faecalis]|uniref:WxL domain-containing protein n=1 Tax=Enterococcus faecalis TaxID=1351 RepID=UPI0001F0D46C|nr:WxL domain-containing protein [Enterococcus faecalis]EFT94872.1 hypothetical protein HMPREF9499_01006 [Enterococcus faecalis TX0012]
MKQIKFKQLATFGLCCSLLVNSLTGVTAIAETVTIESSPTAESTKESTKESTETSEATTETSREEATQETEKQEKVKEAETEVAQVEVEQKEAETSEDNQPNPVPLPASGIGVRAGNVASVREQVELMRIPASGQATITVPDIRLGIVLNSLDKVTLNTADFDIVTKGRTMRTRMIAGGNYQYYLGAVIDFETSKTNNSLDILIPSRTFTAKSTAPYTFDGTYYYMNPINLTIPKYIKAISIKNNQTYDTFAVIHPGFGDGRYRDSINPTITKKSEVNYELSSDASVTVSGDTLSRIFQSFVANSSNEGQNQFHVTLPKQDIVVNVENRKVTENFKDVNGTAIPAPTGFTQGKQTSITNNDYTFTQGGTLAEVYTASNGKAYKLKGWYKGKTKPATLETSKTPSYKVTYDENDDLNVVYEETEAFEFPALTYQFGFVDESGQRVDASTIDLTYDNWYGELLTDNVADWQTITLEKGQVAPTKNNLKEITYPAQALEMVAGRSSQYSAANLTFTLPKYYEKISVYNKNGTFDAAYPFPSIQSNNNPGLGGDSRWFQLKKSGGQSFIFNQTTAAAPIDIQVPVYLREIVHNPNLTPSEATYYTLDKPVYYYLTNRKVTENFVDASGAKITAPTGFKQGKQTVIDSDNFTYTSAKALPASYTADGKSYVLQGWYKGTEKPTTLETSKTPSYSVTYNDQDDLTVVYKEGTISADLTMRGAVDVIDNGAPMEYWEVLLKNTGEVPLTSIKIKPTTDWMSGISAPTELFILGTGQNTKARPITKEQWEAGFEIPLDSSLPVGGQLTINLIGTKVTGQPGQVLKAAVEVTGNFGNLKASDTVRIKDLDQEIKEPTGEGFISVPTFDFGQVGVASATKQHGLKKAADYYGNGTRNPYVRISKTQPNWSLTAQLSQPKSATDSLPTATRLLLGAAPVSSFSNYNQPTELKNAIGTTNAIHLTANNAATSIIANQQFTGSDVYQLDFTFDNIKLEVPANQGTAGQQYQAAVTWNLVTGP